jgi:hypothetical protein
MAWVENTEKSRTRTDLAHSVRNNMTILKSTEEKVNAALQVMSAELAGFPSGLDQNANGILQRTKKHIADLNRAFTLAQELIDQLDVMEWVSDD